ncbi:MAG TPA: ROK family protein [Candidatus Pullichristensenella stercoripullorum]|nr:ROK family protein [Candidatus Pullichristensenella stercoripullorum]
MLYIGIDVGGTTAKAGVVDEAGQILYKSSCKTGIERDFEDIAADMAELCRHIVRESGHEMAEVAAVGVGIPGEQSPKTGLVAFCNNLGWVDVPLMQRLRDALGLPVYVDNDANVAALAESAFGASKDVSSSILITLGTGVGGGIVRDQRIHTGAHGVGGEIGHMVVVVDGEPCNCGHRGCWEKYASATAIIRMGRALMEEKPDCALARQMGGDAANLNAKAVLDLAKAGDADCAGIFETYVKYLCVGLANLINIYDPDMLVLGGGVAHAGNFLLDAVRAALGDYVYCPALSWARVELARMGNDAGIIGAAMLGRNV